MDGSCCPSRPKLWVGTSTDLVHLRKGKVPRSQGGRGGPQSRRESEDLKETGKDREDPRGQAGKGEPRCPNGPHIAGTCKHISLVDSLEGVGLPRTLRWRARRDQAYDRKRLE